MEKNKLLVGVVGVIVLILLVVSVYNVSSTVSSAINALADKLNIPLGATPGTTITDNITSVGGVEKYTGATFTATSSVVCSVRNPWSNVKGVGTSSIDRISVYMKGNNVAAQSLSISTSSTAFASSTKALMSEITVPALSRTLALWTPRHASSSDSFAPNNNLFWYNGQNSSPFFLDGAEYLNVRVASTSPGGEKFTGNCTVELTKL